MLILYNNTDYYLTISSKTKGFEKYKRKIYPAGVMAQGLRVFVALAKDLGSVPTSHSGS